MSGRGCHPVVMLGLLVLTVPRPARAAFEAPPPDAAALALGGAEAWPDAGRLSDGGAALFGAPARMRVSLGTLQWAAAPELRRQAVAAATRWRGMELGATLDRLALGEYAETQVMLAVARPVPETGWGGGVGVGLARWGLAGAPARAVPLLARVGAAPRAGLRLAAALRVFVGPDAGRLEERVDLGCSWDAAPGWRLGAACQARAAGTRWRAGLECRPAPGLALRAACLPAEGGVAFGVGVWRGGLRLDATQSRHPRLGALLAAVLSLQAGGAAAPPGAPPGPGEDDPGAGGER